MPNSPSAIVTAAEAIWATFPALVRHAEGDVVEVQAPAGVRRLKVVAIPARVGEGQQTGACKARLKS